MKFIQTYLRYKYTSTHIEYTHSYVDWFVELQVYEFQSQSNFQKIHFCCENSWSLPLRYLVHPIVLIILYRCDCAYSLVLPNIALFINLIFLKIILCKRSKLCIKFNVIAKPCWICAVRESLLHEDRNALLQVAIMYNVTYARNIIIKYLTEVTTCTVYTMIRSKYRFRDSDCVSWFVEKLSYTIAKSLFCCLPGGLSRVEWQVNVLVVQTFRIF